MNRALGVSVLVLCAGAAVSQPIACTDSSDHCDAGFFCDPAGHCRECLSCTDLKREQLTVAESCIKSVSKCGPCLAGLVEDPSGNVNAQCVPAGSVDMKNSATSNSDGPPSYMWPLLAVGILFFLLAIALVAYVLRNFDHLKILTSTRASLQQPQCAPTAADEEHMFRPSPFNPNVSHQGAMRPTSPPLDPSQETNFAIAKRDSCEPFLAPAGRGRESSQEANMFNFPHYVRRPDPPPSYNDAMSDDEFNPDLHDDPTAQSTWTPNEPHPNANANANQDTGPSGVETSESEGPPAIGPPAVSPPAIGPPPLSLLLREARNTVLLRPLADAEHQPTPSKVMRLSQDTNNNSDRQLEPSSAGEGSSSRSGGGAAGGTQLTALNFNITLQQHNDIQFINQ